MEDELYFSFWLNFKNILVLGSQRFFKFKMWLRLGLALKVKARHASNLELLLKSSRTAHFHKIDLSHPRHILEGRRKAIFPNPLARGHWTILEPSKANERAQMVLFARISLQHRKSERDSWGQGSSPICRPNINPARTHKLRFLLTMQPALPGKQALPLRVLNEKI